VVALGALKEPHLALIGRTELPEPPEREVVPALRALDLDRGQGPDLLSFIVHDHDLGLRPLPLHLHLIGALDLPDIPALPALQLAAGRDHQRLAFRTKHRYIIGRC